jgi:hypothetical protein
MRGPVGTPPSVRERLMRLLPATVIACIVSAALGAFAASVTNCTRDRAADRELSLNKPELAEKPAPREAPAKAEAADTAKTGVHWIWLGWSRSVGESWRITTETETTHTDLKWDRDVDVVPPPNHSDGSGSKTSDTKTGEAPEAKHDAESKRFPQVKEIPTSRTVRRSTFVITFMAGDGPKAGLKARFRFERNDIECFGAAGGGKWEAVPASPAQLLPSGNTEFETSWSDTDARWSPVGLAERSESDCASIAAAVELLGPRMEWQSLMEWVPNRSVEPLAEQQLHHHPELGARKMFGNTVKLETKTLTPAEDWIWEGSNHWRKCSLVSGAAVNDYRLADRHDGEVDVGGSADLYGFGELQITEYSDFGYRYKMTETLTVYNTSSHWTLCMFYPPKYTEEIKTKENCDKIGANGGGR